MKNTNGFFIIVVTAVIILISAAYIYRSSTITSKTTIAASGMNIDDSLINYGRELVAYTGRYFGPSGTIVPISNGMSCQNCHLQAGERPWGNSFLATGANYPRYRSRSGMVETIVHRVNDCFKRSLNGSPPDSNSREMKAIILYIMTLGKKIKRDIKPEGAGLTTLPFMNRAANPSRGEKVYSRLCSNCHGVNGEGIADQQTGLSVYPPLWGDKSYNDGAGLFRLSRFSAFVKWNMPFGVASHDSAALSDEEAWDVAAYVNSRPRPHFNQQNDWKNTAEKPVDEPFGPYSDTFSEEEHKFGPYGPMLNGRKSVVTANPKNK